MLHVLYCRLVLAGLPRPRGRPALAAALLLLLCLIGLVRLREPAGATPIITLPGFPVALAAGAPGHLYLATDAAQDVLALGGADPHFLSSLDLAGSNLGTIAADPATGLFYVADLVLPGLRVLDGTNFPLASIPLREAPVGIAVAPAGRVYVVMRYVGSNQDLDALVVLDTTGGAILATVPIGAGPLAVAVDPVTGRVYVADAGSDTLAVLDGASLASLATIPLGRGVHRLAVDGRAGRVYAGNQDDGTLTVVDAARAAVLATVPVGDRPGALAADGRRHRVYAATAEGRVAVLDGASDRVVAKLPVGQEPVALAVDAATGRAYVVDVADGSLWLIQDGPFGRPFAHLLARTAEPVPISPSDEGDHRCPC